jgi:hypothetical protein
MSPSQRAYHERIDLEISRLFSLSNRFLARALIRHTRDARTRHAAFLALDAGPGNRATSTLAWDIIPEIAYRLGEQSHIAGERGSAVRGMSNERFRIYAGHYIMNCTNVLFNDGKRIRDCNDIDPLEILTHDVANGNPVAFGLDRVSPARSFDQDDALSRYTKEISENRGFDPPYLMWTPEMQNYHHLRPMFAGGM